MVDRDKELEKTTEGLTFNPEDYSLAEILKPQQTALLVIDMQNDFLSHEGFFATSPDIPGTVTQMQSIVPNVQALIEAAHMTHVPVIFTKGYEDVRFRKPGPDLRRAVKWTESDARPESVNSKKGTWGAEFYNGINPKEGDIVVEKNKWSAFDGKDKDGRTLQKILETLGIKTLVVAGVVAETCIETSIRDAYDRNYFVVVAKNSVGSNQADQLKARMDYWGAGFIGDVLEEAEIQQYWSSAQDKPSDEK